MAAPNEIGIRITADGRVLIAETGRATRALNEVGDQARETGRDMDRMAGQIETLNSRFSIMGNIAATAIGALVGGFSIHGLVAMNDELTNLDSRLKLVTYGSANLAAVQDDLFARTQKSQTSYQDTANLFTQMARSTGGLGVQQATVLDFTDKVSKGLVISGAAAESSKAALVQFSQAMQSGVLRGEEFNSLNEQAPFLLDALAVGLGKARGELKGLADNGQLTANVVFPAMLRGMGEVDAQFAQITPTVGRATQALQDHGAMALHEFDKSSGASQKLAASITFLNQNLDGMLSVMGVVAEGGLLLSAVYAGKMVAAFGASKIAAIAKLEADRALLVSDAEVAASALTRAERMQLLKAQDLDRARAAIVSAEQQVAAERAIAIGNQQATLVVLAADRERYASTAILIRSEIQLEQTRLQAQISEIGRAQRTAAMAALSVELAAANTALIRTETALAAAELEVAAGATASAAAEARLTVMLEAGAVAAGEAAASMNVLNAARVVSVETAGAAAAATGGFGAVLSMLGGPIGIAVIALGLLAFNWDKVSTAASNAADKSKKAVTDIEEALKKSKVIQANDGLATLKTEYAGSKKNEAALRAVPTAGMPDYAKAELNAAIAAESERGSRIRDAIQKADKDIADFKIAQQEKALVGSGRVYDAKDGKVYSAEQKAKDVPIGLGVATSTKDYIEKRRNDAQLLSDALKEENKEYQRQLTIADGNAELIKQVNAAHQTALKEINDKNGEKSKKDKGGISAATDTQLAGIAGKIAAAEQESVSTQKLNEGQKLAITIGEQLARTTDKKVIASLEAKQALAEELGALLQHNEVEKDYAARTEKLAETRSKELEKLRETLSVEKEKTATYGMAKGALEALEQTKLESLLSEKEWALALDQSNLALATEVQHLRAKADLQRQLTMTRTELGAKEGEKENGKKVDFIERQLNKEDPMQEEMAVHQARLQELQTFHDARVENEQRANGLIEAENSRHTASMTDMQQSNDQRAYGMMSQSTGEIYNLLKSAGKEKTALGKASFIATKALAVAEILMNTERGAAAALGLGPFGIPMSTYIKVAGYASAGIVAGTAIAEASAAGGYDIPAGKNPIVQTHAEEMILPKDLSKAVRRMAKSNSAAGDSKAASNVGSNSGGDIKFTIVNQTTGRIDKVTEQRLSANERMLIIQEAVKASASEMSNPNSRSHKAVKNAFGMQTARE